MYFSKPVKKSLFHKLFKMFCYINPVAFYHFATWHFKYARETSNIVLSCKKNMFTIVTVIFLSVSVVNEHWKHSSFFKDKQML